MQICTDDDAFSWIRDGRLPYKDRKDIAWTGNFVHNLLPACFESYAKVLHRIDARYDDIDNPLSPSEIAVLRVPRCENLRDFIVERRNRNLGTRIRWAELCKLLAVPFAPEIHPEWYVPKLEEPHCWPRLLSGPSDSVLDDQSLAELVSVLARFMADALSFFRFSRWQLPSDERPRMFCGKIEELNGFLRSERYRLGPEYWWPSNHTWCVCSEYDLPFTIVGGTQELISAVLANDILECIPVEPATRIDYLARAPEIP
ncbi:MAG TPA: hypothetical protein VMH04_04500 [Candidatus Solibacter sp.]|nr:hypothetical protein [Candidatus Solibacter sp.]